MVTGDNGLPRDAREREAERAAADALLHSVWKDEAERLQLHLRFIAYVAGANLFLHPKALHTTRELRTLLLLLFGIADAALEGVSEEFLAIWNDATTTPFASRAELQTFLIGKMPTHDMTSEAWTRALKMMRTACQAMPNLPSTGETEE